MKSKSAFAACFSILLLASISCRKEAQVENVQRVEASETFLATVPSGQSYTFDAIAGSSLTIEKQPLHYQRSEVSTLSDGRKVYRYAAAKGYTGLDEVTLLQSTTTSSFASGGCYNGPSIEHQVTSLKTIVIKFSIAN